MLTGLHNSRVDYLIAHIACFDKVTDIFFFFSLEFKMILKALLISEITKY